MVSSCPLPWCLELGRVARPGPARLSPLAPTPRPARTCPSRVEVKLSRDMSQAMGKTDWHLSAGQQRRGPAGQECDNEARSWPIDRLCYQLGWRFEVEREHKHCRLVYRRNSSVFSQANSKLDEPKFKQFGTDSGRCWRVRSISNSHVVNSRLPAWLSAWPSVCLSVRLPRRLATNSCSAFASFWVRKWI